MQAQCLGLDRGGRQAREIGSLVIDRMDSGNPRGSILPCTNWEAYRQSVIAHLELVIRGLEHLLAASGGCEQAELEAIIAKIQALRDRIEAL